MHGMLRFICFQAPRFNYLHFTNTSFERVDRSVAGLFDMLGEGSPSEFINQNKHLRCDEGMKMVVERVISAVNYPMLVVRGSFCADKNVTLTKYILDTAPEFCERLWHSGFSKTFSSADELCTERLSGFALTVLHGPGQFPQQ